MHTGSLYHQLNRLEMRSKPILGGGLVSLCTTEVGIEVTIKAKVVFLGYCTRFGCRKLAICARTVSMQALTVILPEWNCQIYTRVSTDVNWIQLFCTRHLIQHNRGCWSFQSFRGGSLWNRFRGSDSCMLLASGWSGPAVISFGPSSIDKNSSFGRSRSLGSSSSMEFL